MVGAAFVALGDGPAQAVTFTEVESNDTFATGQDIGTISPDTSVEVLGNTTESLSADFYRFSVEAGNFLTLNVLAPGGPTGDDDPVLGLFGSDGNVLEIDDDGGAGFNSLIKNFRITSSGLYVAAVSRFDDFDFDGGTDDISTPTSFTYQFQASATPVPEPSSALGTIAVSALGVGWMLKRRHKKENAQ